MASALAFWENACRWEYNHRHIQYTAMKSYRQVFFYIAHHLHTSTNALYLIASWSRGTPSALQASPGSRQRRPYSSSCIRSCRPCRSSASSGKSRLRAQASSCHARAQRVPRGCSYKARKILLALLLLRTHCAVVCPDEGFISDCDFVALCGESQTLCNLSRNVGSGIADSAGLSAGLCGHVGTGTGV